MHRSLSLALRLVTMLAVLVVVAVLTVPKTPALSAAPVTAPDSPVLPDSPNFCPATDLDAAPAGEELTAPGVICGPPCCKLTPTGRCACIIGCV